jgi:hypothetical protein
VLLKLLCQLLLLLLLLRNTPTCRLHTDGASPQRCIVLEAQCVVRLLSAAELHKTLRLASLVDTQTGMHNAPDWSKQI